MLGLVVYLFTKDLFTKRAGIMASLLVLVNPFLFLYAFEARTYMLLTVLSTLSLWLFLKKRWVPYILVTTAALYSHHFAIFIIFTQILYYLCTTTTKKTFTNKNSFLSYIKAQFTSSFLYSVAIILVLYSPWIPILYDQTKRVSASFWVNKPVFHDLTDLYITFIAKGSDTLVSMIVLLSSLTLLVIRGYKNKKDILLYFWLIIPAVLTFVISQLGRPIFFDRYLTECAPAVSILLASFPLSTDKYAISISNTSLFAKLYKKAYLPWTLIIIIFTGLMYINANTFTHPTKQPMRELTNFIKSNEKHSQVIDYYTDHLNYFELKYYGVHPKIYTKNSIPFFEGTALIDNIDIIKQLPRDKELLIVASGDISRIQISGYVQERMKQFGDLYLYWYRQQYLDRATTMSQ